MGYLLLLPWSLLDPLGEMYLRTLPGVAEVTAVRDGVPKHRIVHLIDWHHVPRDLFLLDLEHSRQVKLTKDEADKEFAVFLDQVEKVQMDQMAVLRLLKRHGLKEVFCEGISSEDVLWYREYVSAIDWFVSKLEDDLKSETDKKRRAVYEVFLLGERERLLNLGAAGRLFMKKELDVAPLEDAKVHREAKPIKDGKICPDPAKIQARRDAIVRNCVTRKTAVIILGASHNLTDSLRRMVGTDFEYIRVRVKSYEE